MPLHDFQCPAGHVTEAFVDHGVNSIVCPKCVCGPECVTKHMPGYEVLHLQHLATKVFLTPPMGFVSAEIRYDSPIDGRVITSKRARADDLARSGCRPYDPGMKQDYDRRCKESETRLENEIGETVDREIALMPARKREKLEAEMQGGMSVEPQRLTAPLKPLKVDTHV